MGKKSKESKVSEPSVTYGKHGKNHLVFFNSYDEMNAFDLKEMGELKAVERFKHITFTLQNLYADVLKTKLTDMKIHFK